MTVYTSPAVIQEKFLVSFGQMPSSLSRKVLNMSSRLSLAVPKALENVLNGILKYTGPSGTWISTSIAASASGPGGAYLAPSFIDMASLALRTPVLARLSSLSIVAPVYPGMPIIIRAL